MRQDPIKPFLITQWLRRRRRADAVALACILGLFGCVYVQIYKPGGADEAYYLGQLSSILEDGDLDLRNDVLWMVSDPMMTAGLLTRTQASGRLDNVFSIGPALVWSPAYTAGRAWVRAGMTDDLRRWGHPHVTALSLMAIVVLTATMWMARGLLRVAGCSRMAALGGAAALLAGSPLLFYGFANYGGSHLPSVFASFLYVATLFRLARTPGARTGIVSGLALGFLCIMRWQDAIFGIMAPMVIFGSPKGRNPAIVFKTSAAFLVGVFVFASLQMHVWLIERGTLLTIPQGESFMKWSSPQIMDFLFAGYRGLLPWSPIYALGIVGLLIPWKCRIPAPMRWAALTVMLAEIYVNACVWDWWSGASYGQRRMISSLPLVAIGLVNLSRHLPRWISMGLFMLIVGWGVVTLHLHLSLAHDLTLLVTGNPSETHAERDQIHQANADHAREMLTRWKPGLSEANYFEYDFIGGSGPARLVTLTLISFTILTTLLLIASRGGRRLPSATLLFLGGWMAVLHLRLLFGSSGDDAELARWQQIAENVREKNPREALAGIQATQFIASPPAADSSPKDAYAYLAFALLIEQREMVGARALYDQLKLREYQSLELTRRP